MTRISLLFTFLLCFSLSFGQTKHLNGVISLNGDSSFWHKYLLKQLEKLSLPSLDTTAQGAYCRVWTNRQVIDIWQKPGGTFAGKLTTWTDEYISVNEEPTNRSFIVTKNLSDDTATLVSAFIQNSKILAVPTDDSVTGWKQGFDGITYIIEQSSADNYSFKTYWTPEAQNSLEEAKQVQDFIDRVFHLTNAQHAWNEFSKTIPFECYTNGGLGVVCKVLTRKERKIYMNERRKYRRQK